MTRINLVPPSELTDQHLFVEFREIKMIPKALARSLQAERSCYLKVRGEVDLPDLETLEYIFQNKVLERIPPKFTLGPGHVTFFYDKGAYLADRYEDIRKELTRRGISFNRSAELDPDEMFVHHPDLCNNYFPTERDLALIRQRIPGRVARKPNWYRYHGVPLTEM